MTVQVDAGVGSGEGADLPTADAPVRVDTGDPRWADIVLRPITTADEPFLRDLYASTRAPELAATPWTDEQRREFCDSQFGFQDASYRQAYPHARFDVVESGGLAVGRLLVADGPDVCELLDIALVPDCRDRGLGTGLLRWLQARSATAGRTVVLFVEPGGPAERLYERLGFRMRTDGELHREMVWRAEAVGAAALERFCDLAMDDAGLRAALAGAPSDEALTHLAMAGGLARGLAFGPDDVGDLLRTNRRAWFERAIR